MVNTVYNTKITSWLQFLVVSASFSFKPSCINVFDYVSDQPFDSFVLQS